MSYLAGYNLYKLVSKLSFALFFILILFNLIGCQSTPREVPVITIGASAAVPHPVSKKIVSPKPHLIQVQTNRIKSLSEPIVNQWRWPVRGTLSYLSTKNGVDFYGEENQNVYAINAGKVVYANNQLPGYGNLIIIRHANAYLSAYAHNKSVLVKEGELVSSGQKISIMGNSGTKKVKLHFEIRKGGLPVSPIHFLKNQAKA